MDSTPAQKVSWREALSEDLACSAQLHLLTVHHQVNNTSPTTILTHTEKDAMPVGCRRHDDLIIIRVRHHHTGSATLLLDAFVAIVAGKFDQVDFGLEPL